MNNRKEIERLKWKILKRSDRFQKTWAHIRKPRPILDDDLKFVKQWIDTGTVDEEIKQKWLNAKMDFSNDKYDHWPYPEMKDVVFQYYSYLVANAPKTEDFDEMWQTVFVKQKPIYDQIPIFKRPIEDYRDRINKDIDIIVHSFQRQINRNPNINEIKTNLNKLFGLNNSSTYLVITQYDRTNKELKTLLKDISDILKRNVRKKNRVRKDEFERYLKILDLRQDNVKWKDISKQIYPKKKWEESVRVSLNADLKKAKRLIQDVETGKF